MHSQRVENSLKRISMQFSFSLVFPNRVTFSEVGILVVGSDQFFCVTRSQVFIVCSAKSLNLSLMKFVSPIFQSKVAVKLVYGRFADKSFR